MPNSKDVFKWVVEQISLDETIDEIKSIAYLLIENEFQISRSQIIASVAFEGFDQKKLKTQLDRINLGEPIQYIIGWQGFYGRSFKVNSAVLIPRPETEQLVTTVIEYVQKLSPNTLRILDIGTGSGCIPITLSLELRNIEVIGIDVSHEAIVMAQVNNKLHAATAQFLISDVLIDELPENNFDIIVSNPPYITEKEKTEIKINVLNFEPHSALFVPNDDPLRFYKIIASKSKTKLRKGGLLVVEINEKFGEEVVAIFNGHSYQSIEIVKDLAGKDRIVRAVNG